MERVGVDAENACAEGDVSGRETGELFVERCNRGTRDEIDNNYAEDSRRLLRGLRE